MKKRDDSFDVELKKRDDKIAQLEKLILEKTTYAAPPPLSPAPTPYSPDLFNDYDGYELANVRANDDRRQHIGTLFIGASIIRYVNLGSDVMKVCLPGARADQLWSNLVELNQSYLFDRVVIHVGTNYLPRQFGKRWFDWRKGERSKEYARDEMGKFLDAVASLMPESEVIYSSVLPTGNRDFAPAIITFNRWMKEICYDLRIGFIEHRSFWLKYDAGIRVICDDWIHLNYRGVDVFTQSLKTYLLY